MPFLAKIYLFEIRHSGHVEADHSESSMIHYGRTRGHRPGRLSDMKEFLRDLSNAYATKWRRSANWVHLSAS